VLNDTVVGSTVRAKVMRTAMSTATFVAPLGGATG
jgi:hypothetical protein